jgi:hypothetical protein
LSLRYTYTALRGTVAVTSVPTNAVASSVIATTQDRKGNVTWSILGTVISETVSKINPVMEVFSPRSSAEPLLPVLVFLVGMVAVLAVVPLGFWVRAVVPGALVERTMV